MDMSLRNPITTILSRHRSQNDYEKHTRVIIIDSLCGIPSSTNESPAPRTDVLFSLLLGYRRALTPPQQPQSAPLRLPSVIRLSLREDSHPEEDGTDRSRWRRKSNYRSYQCAPPHSRQGLSAQHLLR